MKIKLTTDQINLIETGNIVEDGTNTWYFLPAYFKKDIDGNFEIEHLNKLSEELKKELHIMRQGNENP